MILAISEPIHVAMISAGAIVLAGIPGAIAAILTARTRRENSEQHGSSQEQLAKLADEVRGAREDVRDVKADVRDLRGRVGDLEDLEQHRRKPA